MYTDTTNAPKVYLEYEPGRPVPVSYSTDTGMVGKTRRETTTRYEFRGLTRAAADSIAAAKSDTSTTARSVRISNAGHYNVEVTAQSFTAWS